MCGIMGVLAKGDAAPLLMRGLQCLEYRGYDSAGIATVASGRLEVRRAVGKLGNLSDLVARDPLAGRAGIGHTRWATHGAATIANAHPQRAGGVVVVHNGIIENFRELREELGAAGHFFESETDTETVVALLHRAIAAGKAPQQAVATVLKRLRGAFALCFLFEGEEDLLICARRGSPLVIGHGEGEVFVGSDAIAMAPLTNRITYLEEGDWAVLRRSTVEIHDEHDRIVIRPVVRVEARTSATSKAGYSHFMAKEIADQPVVLAEALAHYLRDNRITLPEDLGSGCIDFRRAA